MDQTKNSKSVAQASFTTRLSAGFDRALNSKTKWADKDQFLDVIYWIRQIIGLILGVCWGFLALKGLAGIALYVLINAIIVYIYTVSFQQVDEDEFGGIWDIMKEGFMTSMSTFMVSWIVVYTSFHSQ